MAGGFDRVGAVSDWKGFRPIGIVSGGIICAEGWFIEFDVRERRTPREAASGFGITFAGGFVSRLTGIKRSLGFCAGV